MQSLVLLNIEIKIKIACEGMLYVLYVSEANYQYVFKLKFNSQINPASGNFECLSFKETIYRFIIFCLVYFVNIFVMFIIYVNFVTKFKKYKVFVEDFFF